MIIIKYYYDLHIHSCLSPCGDNDMTPNNIVNMSIIKGLDIIGICDHNTCGNVKSIMEAAENKILVIPGIEVETSEEIHVVCYFKNLQDACIMEKFIKDNMNKIKNKSEIYGNQYYMDKDDNVVGEEENLLIISTKIDIFNLFKKVSELDGVAIPAHIDRSSYSVLSNLGMIPPELNAMTLEVTKKNGEEYLKKYENYKIISDSDAHYLEDISEPEFTININEKKIEDVLKFLKNV